MHDIHHKLVEEAVTGSQLAVESLLERHLPGLQAFVRLHAGERLLAKESSSDLVQSACREVLQDLPGRANLDEAAFKRWLYLAAERKILDRARYYARGKRDAGREVAAAGEMSSAEAGSLLRACASLYTPTENAEAREELARFELAFQQLPEEYREVILMARILELAHAQIAEQMGRTEASVRVLLHRALARLARLMGRSGA